MVINIVAYIYTVYIFIGWYEDNWFELNLEKEAIECTREQMRIAAEGHITTEALMWNQNINQKTISGMVIFYISNIYCTDTIKINYFTSALYKIFNNNKLEYVFDIKLLLL